MAETPAERRERLAEAERVALAVLQRLLESGELDPTPGVYEVTVAEDVVVA